MYLQHSKSAQCNDCNECTIETTADSTQTTSEDVAYLGCRTRCSSSLAAACTQFTLIKLNSGNFLEISLAPQRISKSQRSKMIKMRASLGEGKDMATHQVWAVVVKRDQVPQRLSSRSASKESEAKSHAWIHFKWSWMVWPNMAKWTTELTTRQLRISMIS